MDNKYVNRSKISEAKFRELVRLFALDLTATQIAELSGLNRNTVNRYIKGIRGRIAEYCAAAAPFTETQMNGGIGVDHQKITWLGIREKTGSIYTVVSSDQNLPVELDKSSELDLVVNLKNEIRIWHKDRKELQKRNSSKLHCIEGFRGFLKSRLEKFKGIHSQTYVLHLKESEFRYNNPKSELYHLTLKIIRNHPLF